ERKKTHQLLNHSTSATSYGCLQPLIRTTTPKIRRYSNGGKKYNHTRRKKQTPKSFAKKIPTPQNLNQFFRGEKELKSSIAQKRNKKKFAVHKRSSVYNREMRRKLFNNGGAEFENVANPIVYILSQL
ncbi:exodeoxyribonuclease 7 small subunit, partial [Striga asiatica]